MNEQKQNTHWLIDPVHTRIRFDTKYLLITTVSGWFNEFEGSVVTPSDNFHNSKIQFTIFTNSIYTGNQERDNHLRSADFFDTKKYPTLSFHSDEIVVKDHKIGVTGDLRIKDVTSKISFEGNYTGSSFDPLGNEKAGFEIVFTFNRKDFNISYNQFFDKAGVLLSDEVKVICDVQLLKVPENPKI
jgi:polyisoprenoid-binding protein YceI